MKKKIFLTVLVALLAVFVANADTPKKYKGKVYEVVDAMPEYPGGVRALMTFLKDNVRYPAQSVKDKEEGIVIVKFIIEKDGTPTNFTVERSVSPSLDNAAIETLKQMQKWTPGKYKGKPVRVYMNSPIMFRLNPNTKY